MTLSKQIKLEDDGAYPYGTAVVQRRVLDNWARMAESTERARDRWHAVAHIFAAVIVGLLLALMYAAFRAPAPAPAAPVSQPGREVMQLDPDTIITYPNRTLEI